MPESSRSFTFLGTGTSVGVPMIGCKCPVCQSTDPRNQRYRCAVLMRLPGGNLLVDTPPELRLQLLRARVDIVHAVLFTHYHADHLFGLDDLRPIAKDLGGPVPIYCTEEVEHKIRTIFSYAFGPQVENAPFGYVPRLTFKRIATQAFETLGERIVPIPLVHGPFDVLGFRVGDVAYCTDVSEIPPASWPLLEGLDVLIVDALRAKPHPAHFSVDQAVAVAERVRPKQTWLTHMSHDLDHEATNRRLPPSVQLAYDGLTFSF